MNRMVQAAYKYENTSLAMPQQQPEYLERRVRKIHRKKHLRHRVLVKVGMVFFCYSLLLVYLCSAGAGLNYRVLSLEKDIESLQSSNARLEYEIAQGTSLEQIEKTAGTQLGMYKPDLAASIVAPAAASQPVKPAAQARVKVQDTPKQGSLEKIYDALLILADQNN